MSNRDVLDELRGFCNGKAETVYTRAVAEIERLRAAQRWRRLPDEMPAQGQQVIVAHRYVDHDGRTEWEQCEATAEVWKNRLEFQSEYGGLLNVEAWMPFPDPPR